MGNIIDFKEYRQKKAWQDIKKEEEEILLENPSPFVYLETVANLLANKYKDSLHPDARAELILQLVISCKRAIACKVEDWFMIQQMLDCGYINGLNIFDVKNAIFKKSIKNVIAS